MFGSEHPPRGMAVAADGTIYAPYVDRYLGGPQQILVLSADGELVHKFGGWGSAPGMFQFPEGVAVDRAGQVYVADQRNHRVQKFSSAGVQLAEYGQPPGTPVLFDMPTSVVVDPLGIVAVTDGGAAGSVTSRIQRFTADGAFIDEWKAPGQRRSNDPIPPAIGAEGYAQAVALAFDQRGDYYVLGQDHRMFARVSPDGTVSTTFRLPAPTRDPDGTLRAVSVDRAGTVYAIDSDGQELFVFGPDGELRRRIARSGGPNLGWRDLALDSEGNIYFAIGDGVDKLSPTGEVLASWTGTAAEPIQSARYLCVDRWDNVYVVHLVRGSAERASGDYVTKLSPTGEIIGRWGGPKDSAPGKFNDPGPIATDHLGRVYVADRRNDRIQRLTPASISSGLGFEHR